MSFLRWNDDWSTGVDVLDGDHKTLVDLINEVTHSIQQGCDHAAITRHLERLFDYTCYHFRREEMIMEKSGFPNVEAHRRLHRELIDQARSLENMKIHDDPTSLAHETQLFLRHWLVDHILEEDMKYAAVIQD